MRPPLWHPPIELSDHEALIIKRIKRAKLFTFLRLNRLFIFNDEFQEELATIFKDSTVGNSPVPPAQIALAIILQAYLGISDDEVIEEMSRGSTLAVIPILKKNATVFLSPPLARGG